MDVGRIKKFAVLTLVIALTLCSTLSVFAFQGENDAIWSLSEFSLSKPIISDSPDVYAVYEDGTRIVAAYRPTDSGLVEVSKAEFITLLNEPEGAGIRGGLLNTIDSEVVPDFQLQSGFPFTMYEERGVIAEYTRWDMRRRISPYVANETSTPALRIMSCSTSQSYAANISLSSSDKSAVQAQIGMSVEQTYTYSDSVQYTISPYHKGWMEYVPIMYNTYGFLQYCVTTDIYPFYVVVSQKIADIFIARDFNGIPDGIYVVKEAPL